MQRTYISSIAALWICAATLLPIYTLFRGGGEAFVGAWVAVFLGFFCFGSLYLLSWGRGPIVFPRSILLLTPLPILFVAAASLFGTPVSRTTLFGAGFEFGTLGFVLLLTCGVFLGSLANKKAFAFSCSVILLGFANLCFLAWRTFLHVPLTPLELGQVALFLSASAIVAAVYADRSETHWRILFGIAALFLTAGFFFCGSPEVTIAAIVALVSAVGSRYMFDAPIFRPFPIVTTLVTLVFALTLIFVQSRPVVEGGTFIRPSLSDTSFVAGETYSYSLKGALIGAGPASLPYVWNAHRSMDFNKTLWWNTTPLTTYSVALSVAFMFGLLGLVALCLFPVAVYIILFHQRRRSVAHKASFEAMSALALFSFLAMFVYPIGAIPFLIGCIALGSSTGHLMKGDVIRYEPTGLSGPSLSILCAVAGVVLAYVGFSQLLAMRSHAIGESLVKKDIAASVAPLQAAADTWPISTYQLDAAQVELNAAITLAQEQKASGTVDVPSLQDSARIVTNYMNMAVAGDSRNMDTHLSKAALYALLSSIGFSDVTKQTQVSLGIAAGLAPTRADVVLDQAIYAKIQGDIPAARTYAQKALLLKPDYGDARAFLRSLPVQ